MNDQTQRIKDLQTQVAKLRRDLKRKEEQPNQQQVQKLKDKAQDQAWFPVNPSDVYAVCYKCGFLEQDYADVLE